MPPRSSLSLPAAALVTALTACTDGLDTDGLNEASEAGEEGREGDWYIDPESLEAATEAAVSLCPKAQSAQLRTLILPLDLDDSFRVACD